MDYDFVEIGTSDFDTLIQTCPDTAVGLSVDPIQYYLDRLPVKPHVTKVNAAVSDSDGEVTCYYVPEEKIRIHNLPQWVRGCNSIGAPHPTVASVLAHAGLSADTMVESFTIPKLSMTSLIRQYNIKSIKYLKIDTEGHDCVILAGYIDAVLHGVIPPAQKILFESNILTPRATIDATISRLVALGYIQTSAGGNDTIMEYCG